MITEYSTYTMISYVIQDSLSRYVLLILYYLFAACCFLFQFPVAFIHLSIRLDRVPFKRSPPSSVCTSLLDLPLHCQFSACQPSTSTSTSTLSIMDPSTFVDPRLTRSDLLVLENLLRHVNRVKDSSTVSAATQDVTPEDARQDQEYLADVAVEHDDPHATHDSQEDQKVIDRLNAWNNPKSDHFDPTVFVAWDLPLVNLPAVLDRGVIQPYIRWARTVVRMETDVVMLTHLILYFTTSVPSVLHLYYSFSWYHGVLHWLMQSYYVGTYTLMMHQHIHMNGILSRKYAWFDRAFPYIMDPLMGHTWNSYYHHHVKHHHIEANGPDDLSSTIRYQRDDLLHFLHYVGRFFFFVWLDLPIYFIGKKKTVLALKTLGSELISYFILYVLATRVNFHATLFAFLLPLVLVRLVLMVGNWGQHALVDEIKPDSDFRSSITLIDVAVSLNPLASPSRQTRANQCFYFWCKEQSILLQ